MDEISGKIILITGAAKGIGFELAQQVVTRCRLLILLDKDKDALQELLSQLSAHASKLRYFVIDLCDPKSILDVYRTLKGDKISVDILINNAAIGTYAPFIKTDWEKLERVIALNIVALTRLTYLFGRDMAQRGRGKILNISSTAGFQPVPFLSCYSASKAYVTNFSESIAQELKKDGVDVYCLCPGATSSDYFRNAGMEHTTYVQKVKKMSAREVAVSGLSMLSQNKVVKVSGAMNNLRTFLGRFIPRQVMARLSFKRFS